MVTEKLKAQRERLRGLTDLELAEELGNLRFKLFNLRRENTTRQLQNVAAISTTKRQISRVMTLLRERNLIAH